MLVYFALQCYMFLIEQNLLKSNVNCVQNYKTLVFNAGSQPTSESVLRLQVSRQHVREGFSKLNQKKQKSAGWWRNKK